MLSLSKRQLNYLRHCIKEAAAWRGSLLPEQWPEFDRRIRRANEVMRIVAEQQRFLDDLEAKDEK